jgi:hypothetical protein
MTTRVRRFAEGTRVTVESSRAEIATILAKHGVSTMAWGTTPTGDHLQFNLHGGTYRFEIKRPTTAEIRQLYPTTYDADARLDGEWRRRWRANVLLLKAKLEFIAGGDTTIDREMLAFRVLRDGSTLEQFIAGGGLPALTAGAGAS